MNFESRQLGPGLELHLLRIERAAELFAVVDRNRQHLRRWLPWLDSVKTLEDEEAFLRRCEEQLAHDVALNCGIFCDGKIVGGVGVHPIDYSNRKVDIGYWLDEPHQGRGLATTACRAVLDHLFDQLQLNRAIIYCATKNSRSRAIPERLGFTFEGVHREAQWLHDHFVDLACYSMLARDWRCR